jgi:heterotetrameric sarcosine oxidase alpha subunit
VSARTTRIGVRLLADTIRFSFDGREYSGQRGDTAASALLARGVKLFGRSVKYRRPRGLLAAGPEEPSALLTVGTAPTIIPNVPASQIVLREGMVLTSQNRWPSLRYDLGSLLRAGAAIFGAGFYYKTFMWPSWRSYERIIRNLAGLGAAPGAANVARPSIEHLSCDVLIAGAGPAGLAAGLASARAGAAVVICEREPVLGGELEFETATIDGRGTAAWLDAVRCELALHGTRLLTDTAVVGGSDGLMIAHGEPGGLAGQNAVYRIRPRRFVIATGAVESPIAFIDNDRPGVMLLGAAERLLACYGVAVGKRPLLFGNNDRLYAAATRLCSAGIRVRAIVDSRSEAMAGETAAAAARVQLARAGVECLFGHAVIESEGGLTVHGAKVAPLEAPRSVRRFECDAILVSGGWSPAIHAALHEGGVRRYAGDIGAFIADRQPDWRLTAGAASGIQELAAVVTDGFAAGARAAQAIGAVRSAGRPPAAIGDGPPRLVPFWRSPASPTGEKRQFVDHQNDVTVADLRQALAEGFIDIEHVKRYTALGVGTDQGRTSNLLGAAIVAELRGANLNEVGASRTRPPYHPVTLAALVGHRAGANLRVVRRTPLHAWHETHGGVLEPAAYWMRPRFYRTAGENAGSAGIAEAAHVRSQVGILDASTLGKIEVAGAAAAHFLDRLYLTRASTIPVGRGKYTVNLREDGMVLDDGIVLRIAEDRFLATTSSGHAEHILSHFEYYRDTEWSGAQVALSNVTEAWAVIVVAGPASRDTLRAVLGEDCHASLARMSHMDFATLRWRERTLRVLRASFSGELAFELHCRPDIAMPLWQTLIGAGVLPYGLEALDILRVEKGYLVDSELTGQTTPMDLGMQGLLRAGNPCIGRALLDRPAFHEAKRPRLVGLRAADGKASIRAGAQITSADSPRRSLGYITASVYSPTLREWIALALVARTFSTNGTLLVARDPLRGGDTPVRVTASVHLDPAGERMKS